MDLPSFSFGSSPPSSNYIDLLFLLNLLFEGVARVAVLFIGILLINLSFSMFYSSDAYCIVASALSFLAEFTERFDFRPPASIRLGFISFLGSIFNCFYSSFFTFGSPVLTAFTGPL
jgi:hypothetical protein